MTETWTLTFEIEVQDPQELWEAAIQQAATEGLSDPTAILGTKEEPEVGACLQMLLDRNEHLKGAQIEESTSAYEPPFLLFEEDDDDEPCIDCGAVPGTPEYGTVGDGFDGRCPSCADKEEAEREPEDWALQNLRMTSPFFKEE